MRWITRKSKAAIAATRWRDQYAHYFARGDKDKVSTYEKLQDLGPSPNPDDVDAIIGNDSWTSCRCNDCAQDREAVCELGAEPDYDSATAHICIRCLRLAVAAFEVVAASAAEEPKR